MCDISEAVKKDEKIQQTKTKNIINKLTFFNQKNTMKKTNYFAPAIEEILMEVEKGIAQSTTEGGSGWNDGWNGGSEDDTHGNI